MFRKVLATGAAILTMAAAVHAHTISYGFENAGPGSVTIWFGSYHSFAEANSDGKPNEGYLQIQGINGNSFPLTSLDFNLATGTQPAGLVNSHFISVGLPVTLWQGVTFTAVQAGQYSFFFNPNASLGGNPATSDVFAPWNSSVQNGTFTLTPAIVQAPDGGSTIALLGLAMSAVAGFRRKFAL